MAYIWLVHPGLLNVPLGLTNTQALAFCDDHKHDKKLFHETINIEFALKKQISEAIDEVYMVTNTITDNIPTILQYLFNNYGDIFTQHIRWQRTRSKKNYPWQHP